MERFGHIHKILCDCTECLAIHIIRGQVSLHTWDKEKEMIRANLDSLKFSFPM